MSFMGSGTGQNHACAGIWLTGHQHGVENKYHQGLKGTKID
jgi:hypothetical protein